MKTGTFKFALVFYNRAKRLSKRGKGADRTQMEDTAWKAEFEKSLLENYGVTPDHYEDLGDGVYPVYGEIDGKVIPYVTVDSAIGDYLG